MLNSILIVLDINGEIMKNKLGIELNEDEMLCLMNSCSINYGFNNLLNVVTILY